MDNTNILVKSNFGVVDYVSIVNAIASEFFDEDGTYTPHIGRMNAMRVFYNKCVVESKFDIEHNIVDALEMEVLVEDAEFIAAFNEAIKGDGMVRLDFANAYADAMDIVNTKKNSFGNVVDILRSAIVGIADKINPIFSGDNFEKLTQMVDQISKGDFSAGAIAEAYGNSKRIKEISDK